jgi:phosphoribosyl-ATP pyrophosphohydrolase
MKLEELYKIIKSRKEVMPPGSYIASLINKGDDRIIQKVGEEAIEVVIAAKNISKEKLVSESTDLLFHLLILLETKGVTLDEIYEELRVRNLS